MIPLLVIFCSLHTEWILEGPTDVSVALGENATFHCLGNTSVDGFYWFMNNTKCESGSSYATSIGLYCSFHKNYGEPVTTEITVDTNYGYNYAEFKCTAYTDHLHQTDKHDTYRKDDKENSSSALLTVQGMTIILL